MTRPPDPTGGTDAPVPAASSRPAARSRPPARRRRQLVGRLWHAAEQQVAEIEARLASLSGDPAQLEREAKTLAVIARTLRDLSALEEEARNRAEVSPDAGNPARTLAAFRAELAQRLAGLRDERPGGAAAGEPQA